MKRTFATLGLMGLGLMSLTAPAVAADKVVICHATNSVSNPYESVEVSVNALNGHDADAGDIIPPNSVLPDGRNWTATGMATHLNNCVPVPSTVDPPVVVPPVVVPPVETPVVEAPVVEAPVVEAPVVQAPVTTATPTVQTPAAPAARVQTPARTGAVAVSQGTNQGFNAQTAVGGAESAPTWLAGLGIMLGAGALVAVRRRSQEQAG